MDLRLERVGGWLANNFLPGSRKGSGTLQRDWNTFSNARSTIASRLWFVSSFGYLDMNLREKYKNKKIRRKKRQKQEHKGEKQQKKSKNIRKKTRT